MRAVALYCPHLNRDIHGLLARVPDLRIQTGLPTVPGEDGCLQMHQQAVREAQADGAPLVFVMEDDCEFTNQFSMEGWQAAIDAVAPEFDVLVGGCVQTYDPQVVRRLPFDQTLIEVSGFHSAHCIVYFASSYDKVLRTQQPHDVSIGRVGRETPEQWHSVMVGCRVAMVYPFVAVQRPSFSGILHKDVDYVPLYQQYEVLLGHRLRLR